MPPSSKVSFSITWESVLKVVLVLIAVWFLWIIRDIVLLLFVSLILASAFDPTVDWLQRYRVPRSISIILIYIVFFTALTFAVIGISGPIATEVKSFANELPNYYYELNTNLHELQDTTPLFSQDRIDQISGGLDDMIVNLTRFASGNLFGSIVPVLSSFFGGLLSVLMVLVITFYFTVQENSTKNFIAWCVPKSWEHDTVGLIEKIERKLGLWLRGQLLLSLAVFVLTYAGLSILGVRYALVLALLAGFFEVVPYLGPFLGAIPAVFITLIAPEWGGFVKGMLVAILYVIVQQIENNLLVPRIMARTVGLNPIIVIIAILVGAKISGIVGALIAVPVATAVSVYLDEQGYRKEAVR